MGYEHFTALNADGLWTRIDAAFGRFASLLGRVGTDAPVHGSDWSSGETARHVLTVMHRYTRRDLFDRDGLVDDAADIAALNTAELRKLEAVPVEEVIEQIGAELDEIRARLSGHDLEQRMPFHAGTTVDLAGGLGNLLGELTMHGLDVARGSGETFDIDPGDALAVLNMLVQIAPGFLSTPDTIGMGFRTRGATPWMFRFGPEGTESGPMRSGDRLDAKVRGPSPTLLRCFYQRDSLAQSVRGGMVVVGGRRPWVALRLPSLLPRV